MSSGEGSCDYIERDRHTEGRKEQYSKSLRTVT